MEQLQEKQARSLVAMVQRMLGPNQTAVFPAPPAEDGDEDDDAPPSRVILSDGYVRKTPIQPYRIVPRRGLWWKILLVVIMAAVVVVTALRLVGWI